MSANRLCGSLAPRLLAGAMLFALSGCGTSAYEARMEETIRAQTTKNIQAKVEQQKAEDKANPAPPPDPNQPNLGQILQDRAAPPEQPAAPVAGEQPAAPPAAAAPQNPPAAAAPGDPAAAPPAQPQ